MEEIIKAILTVIGTILILSIFLWLLWNGLVTNIFGLPEVTYWQSVGLMILSNIIFKSNTYDTK